MIAFIAGLMAGGTLNMLIVGAMNRRTVRTDADTAWNAGYAYGVRASRMVAMQDIIANDTATAFGPSASGGRDLSEGDELAQWGGCYHCRREGD